MFLFMMGGDIDAFDCSLNEVIMLLLVTDGDAGFGSFPFIAT